MKPCSQPSRAVRTCIVQNQPCAEPHALRDLGDEPCIPRSGRPSRCGPKCTQDQEAWSAFRPHLFFYPCPPGAALRSERPPRCKEEAAPKGSATSMPASAASPTPAHRPGPTASDDVWNRNCTDPSPIVLRLQLPAEVWLPCMGLASKRSGWSWDLGSPSPPAPGCTVELPTAGKVAPGAAEIDQAIRTFFIVCARHQKFCAKHRTCSSL
jgi:hypothetical protein